MRIFILILGAFFLLLLIFYIFVSLRINIISKQRKDDVLKKCSEHDRQVINAYIESLHVSMKDVFTAKKKKEKK